MKSSILFILNTVFLGAFLLCWAGNAESAYYIRKNKNNTSQQEPPNTQPAPGQTPETAASPVPENMIPPDSLYSLGSCTEEDLKKLNSVKAFLGSYEVPDESREIADGETARKKWIDQTRTFMSNPENLIKLSQLSARCSGVTQTSVAKSQAPAKPGATAKRAAKEQQKKAARITR